MESLLLKDVFNLPLAAMGQKKLIRFAELNTFPNVLQFPKDMQGKWKDFLKNIILLLWNWPVEKGNTLWAGSIIPQQKFYRR